jgi:hypothetical protein
MKVKELYPVISPIEEINKLIFENGQAESEE